MGAAREVEVAFLMADLSGFTALTEIHGDMHAAIVAMRYVEIAQSALDSRARLVERVGDQVLIVAPDGAGAVRTAMSVFEAVEREPLFPSLRAGIHGGRVVEQDGRYFGMALNLTARVTAHARAGQTLCTEPIAASAHDLEEAKMHDVGLVRFKNIADGWRDTAGMSDVGAVDQPQRRFQVLFGEEDADPRLLQPQDLLLERPDDQRREAFRRLVEQEQLRAAHQRPPHRQHRLFAAAEQRYAPCLLARRTRNYLYPRFQDVLGVLKHYIGLASAEQLAEYPLEMAAYLLEGLRELLSALFVKAVYQLL